VRLDDLVKRAGKLGMPAVGLTDHGNLYGAIDFYMAAKKAKMKSILGCEVYLAPGSMFEQKDVPGRQRASHLTLLAESNAGYENLSRLVTLAHLDGQWQGVPRIDKDALRAHSEGLICLSGCLNGEINELLHSDRQDEAERSLCEFRDIFGPDHFFLELMDHGLEQQQRSTRQLVEWGRKYGLKTVATNDVHFLHRADHESHDILVRIGVGASVHDTEPAHLLARGLFQDGRGDACALPRAAGGLRHNPGHRRALRPQPAPGLDQHRPLPAVQPARRQRPQRLPAPALRGGHDSPLWSRPRAQRRVPARAWTRSWPC
jgi:DNA polymerase III alpha subunit